MFLSILLVAVTSAQQPQANPSASPPSVSSNPPTPNTSPAANSAKTQSAPDSPRAPFFRFLAINCSGLVISGARLARKFRRFFGLGVFANPYGILFLIVGAVVCGIPVTSESHLTSIPFLGSAGTWIADLSGIAVALILSVVRLKPKEPGADKSQVRDLESTPSSNPIVAVIEDAITDRILQRMQAEIVASARRFNWDAIELAARRALAEEMAIRPLDDEKYKAILPSIDDFRPNDSPGLDSRNKYQTLIGLLRSCSFKRLMRGLSAAESEIK